MVLHNPLLSRRPRFYDEFEHHSLCRHDVLRTNFTYFNPRYITYWYKQPHAGTPLYEPPTRKIPFFPYTEFRLLIKSLSIDLLVHTDHRVFKVHFCLKVTNSYVHPPTSPHVLFFSFSIKYLKFPWFSFELFQSQLTRL